MAALRADATLTGMVSARIYDVAPSGADYPHVSLGPTSFFPERRDCMTSRVETFQIDVWARDHERRQPCKAICDAVTTALDMANLSLDDPYALSGLELTLGQVMDDPDGITKHGVLRFEAGIIG